MKAIISPGDALTIVIDDDVFMIPSSSEVFNMVLKAVTAGDSKAIKKLILTKNAVVEWSRGNFRYKDGEMFFGDRIVPDAISSRIRHCIRNDIPVEYILNFFEKLMLNPSKNSVDQLYNFLEDSSIAIDPEGYIIAMKAIRKDWTDKYTGKISNRIGERVSMPRNQVTDNPDTACSTGLHAGSDRYVKWYGKNGDRFVYVRIHPKDVVSVPNDHNYGKIRVSEYVVIGEGTEVLDKMVTQVPTAPESKCLAEHWSPSS